MSENEKMWQEEQRKLNETIQEIDAKADQYIQKVGGVKDEVIELRSTFFEDVTVNMDEPDDVMETYNSIRQQAELLGERERSHRQLYNQLNTLKRMRHSPYFGRIDFQEDGENSTDTIYIGITSLMDRSEEEFLVYDWRAPVSSLYYDYSPGPATYDTPEGTVDGEMKVKRQYIIRNGALRGMFDTGITIRDELLQEVLGSQASTVMKSIVSTIQKEQNQIIRFDEAPYLIVQGVAGSGKTSAALQRVAYLLYRYRGRIQANQIMLFSPNPMFNSYVANVLPELGEENMEQTTFQQYMEMRLQGRFEYEDAFSQLERLLSREDHEVEQAAIEYKSSKKFKDHLDQFIHTLESDGLVFRNIKFRGRLLIPKEQIEEHVYAQDSSVSIPNRLEQTRDWIDAQLDKYEEEEREKDWVKQEIELLSKEDYLKTFRKVSRGKRDQEDTFDDYVEEERLLSKAVVNKYFKSIRVKVEQLHFVHIKQLYRNAFSFEGADLKNHWSAIVEATMEDIQDNYLRFEDVTPFLYLEDQIKGVDAYRDIRYLFIDEAQDYSPFQFQYMKQLFPYARMTLLGDYNQAIYAHNVSAPTLLDERLYESMKYERLTLMRSYRSTKPIIDFTKHLIPGGEEVEPFNRDGAKPTLTQVNGAKQLYHALVKRIHAMQEQGHETIAIICKTAEEARHAYDMINGEYTVRLVTKNNYSFEKGIMVIPAYLAKGIEFDAVIMFDASEATYSLPIEQNLFYTACTRAMHELHLLCNGLRSPFLSQVPNNLYEELELH
ncbi:helicase [Pontibacillus halophilus JSM 076056 = DSM 19796]|uniref:Helicase n=1 Tax=Pontibacillus halophilus JSM 076056 = DSM 19796 TaxID=1385510 RepID=A0A0A5GRE7_9BACI|nr:RNA polymerase recycling motor HelD [Pontibacillus halophilus]KGX93745.1 helicase [Pontibacillus halophilus JSM 076056 = DSM 19796]